MDPELRAQARDDAAKIGVGLRPNPFKRDHASSCREYRRLIGFPGEIPSPLSECASAFRGTGRGLPDHLIPHKAAG